MTSTSAKLRRARQRASTHTPQSTPAPPGHHPPLDQSAVIATNGDVRVVPNDRSSYLRDKMAGEANVTDYDPSRAAARAVHGGADPAVYGAAGASNVRPHLPEGNQNVRSAPGNLSANRMGQSLVRDRPSSLPRKAGEGNVQNQRVAVSPRQMPPQMAPQMAQQMPPQMAPQMPPQMAPQMPQQMTQQLPHHGAGAPGETASPAGTLEPVTFAVGPRSPEEEVADVTIIVATYHRPHLFRHQLQALANQTLRAADLWVWSNDWAMGSHDHEAEAHFTFMRSKVNLGPWVRFTIASEVRTKYVLIMDDDCIPGPGWIKACVERLEGMESKGETAVICASGRVYAGDDPSAFAEVGSSNPENEEAIVDEGTKAWFMTSDLITLFNSRYRTPSPVGWGLHLAAICQEIDVFQIVLPYDPDSRDQWGDVNTSEEPMSLSKAMPNFGEAQKQAWDFYRTNLEGSWSPIALLEDTSNDVQEDHDAPQEADGEADHASSEESQG